MAVTKIDEDNLGPSYHRYHWRRIYLETNFSMTQATEIESRLRGFENRHGESDPALLLINSRGGSVIAMLHTCKVIEESPVPVYALVFGNCHGAAFPIMQVCSKRLANPNSLIGITNNSLALTLPIDADTDPDTIHKLAHYEIEALRNNRERILDILQERLHMHTRDELVELMRSEREYTSEEALKEGFIDEIVSAI